MAMIYNKVFKTPLWVVVKKGSKSKQIAKWFTDHGAKLIEWPSSSYKDSLESYKVKGWAHVFNEPRVVIPPQLLTLSANEHAKKTLSPNAHLVFDSSVGRLNRVIESSHDYFDLFNNILKSQPRLNLSQIFQIGELCHNEDSARYSVLVTIEPCDKTILTELALKVITIGKGVDCEINIEKAEKDKLEEYLESEIINYV